MVKVIETQCGEIICAVCGHCIECNSCGDMPDVCQCGNRLDYSDIGPDGRGEADA